MGRDTSVVDFVDAPFLRFQQTSKLFIVEAVAALFLGSHRQSSVLVAVRMSDYLWFLAQGAVLFLKIVDSFLLALV